MREITAGVFWQDCADVTDLVKKAISVDTDAAAVAAREFLSEDRADLFLTEAGQLALQNIDTAHDFEEWLTEYAPPLSPRAWGSRAVKSVEALLRDYGME